MNLFDRYKTARRANRNQANQQTVEALRHIGLKFDVSRDNTTYFQTKDHRHAYAKAVELVSELFGKFTMPERPRFTYSGVIKNATNKNGHVEDGIIKISASLRTLIGHKASIDIPVIIRNSQLIEPAVFFFDGAPYIICQAALDQLVKHGQLDKSIVYRRMFQPPHVGTLPDTDIRRPIINQQHMFSPGPRSPYRFQRHSDNRVAQAVGPDYITEVALDANANVPSLFVTDGAGRAKYENGMWNAVSGGEASSTLTERLSSEGWGVYLTADLLKLPDDQIMWYKEARTAQKVQRQRTNIDTPAEMPELWVGDVPDEMLDPAERSREGLYDPGTKVKAVEDFEVRERGGGKLIIPKGESGIVMRDIEGDGKMLYISFPAMQLAAPVPKRMVKAAAANVDQVRHEIRDMEREGYPTVDIKEAISRRYPALAAEALKDI